VTAVGATTGISPEVAVSRFYSGGGFSNYFSQPSYQKDAVTAYLKTLPDGTYQGLYNPQGRAYPDVAAQGDNFRIFHQGKAILIGGTSAAAPAFAGFIALLNDVRLRNNLPPLGFLNPFIYSNGSAGFNDISIGKAAGCGTQGFSTGKGWDPVTGYGTPNFGKLKDLVSMGNRTTNTPTVKSAASRVFGPNNQLHSIMTLFLQYAFVKILCDNFL
jgi:tripeptidyl-peptidase-1